MKKVMEAAMQKSGLILICVLLILVWGGISAFQMQRDYLPGINNTTLMVSIRASSYQADQVKQDIAVPLEDAIRRTNGILNVETTSYDGGLLMNLYYPMNYNMAKAESAVNQAIGQAELPDGVNRPSVSRLTTNSFPVLSYSLTAASDKINDLTLESTVQTDIVNRLKAVPGVSGVQTVGGAIKGYVVLIRMKDLVKNGLTVDDFNKSIAADIPALEGSAANVKSSFPIRIEGWDLGQNELKELPIKDKQGNIFPLSSVASISTSLTDVKTVSRSNGQASVILNVMKTPNVNITGVAKQVKEQAATVPLVKSGDVSLNLLVDRAHDLNASLLGLIREGLLGCLFSVLSVLIFFRNVRSTLLIAVSLPIALLAATAVLKELGVTLNILTVSGMIVAMGRIVDDAIVILDNIHRRVREHRGEPALGVLSAAAAEMIPAILASTATTIAVYVPIALVGGIIGASYSGFAWAVVISLAVSFLVAMLVIPAFAYSGWREPGKAAADLEPVFRPFLALGLRHRAAFVSASLLLFLISVYFAAQLPFSLLPGSTSGQIAVKIEMPKGTPLSVMGQQVKAAEAVLKQNPDIANYSATYGSSFTPQADDVFDQGGGYLQQPNVANLSVSLKNERKTDEDIPLLQSALSTASTGAVVTVSNQQLSGDDSTLNIMLTGGDSKTLESAAQLVRGKLAGISGLSVAGKSDLTNGVPKFSVTLNREAIRQDGVKSGDINKILARYMAKAKDFDIPQTSSSVNGSIPVDVYIDPLGNAASDNTQLPVYKPEQVLAALKAETVTGTNGATYRIDQLASVEQSTAVSMIQERDGEPFAVVSAQIISKDISGVSKAVNQALGQVQLPSGVMYSMGGISAQVTQMIVEIAIAVAVSVFLVLGITRVVFKAWKPALAVLISIPLALSGVVITLYAAGAQWNLAALIGILMLTGIVVTNGIVLIDQIERNRRSGLPLRESVMKGSLSRVRPILMTAATTILTLAPLALSKSSDSVVSQVLGLVVIGGMVTSTLNSFVIIPIIYEWMHAKRANENHLTAIDS
ncbi:efflux RND transporter permease subunit [Paenibacillus sp. HN-1]|uniref:efflux RND transporter permease subunit n=1 Tax=Paenibacillus TaxID=44249 RepID=UPI001CA882A0|nr:MULTISPECIES: efflux RND transporter permease subunit [Paenibacillus]MBY9079305.1 efflux RND transporter permease subunit [Paenibacillus sp. CGMCC 1.18879]MBY9087028.1 efflux RND transporter permease subunit [Paenibacillus sinensis]